MLSREGEIELKVYTRRKKKDDLDRKEGAPNQQSDQNPHVPIPESSLDSIPKTGNMSLPSEVDDSDIPIALRKSVRSCTQYPISNYLLSCFIIFLLKLCCFFVISLEYLKL